MSERSMSVPGHVAGLARGRELVFVDRARVVEQATDERRLAVVDRADGDEAQELLVLVARQVGLDVRLTCVSADASIARLGGHQKYPSRFFVSIDASSS